MDDNIPEALRPKKRPSGKRKRIERQPREAKPGGMGPGSAPDRGRVTNVAELERRSQWLKDNPPRDLESSPPPDHPTLPGRTLRGQLKPGAPGLPGAGRPKKSRWMVLTKDRYGTPPTNAERKLAAQGAGVKLDDVPPCDTIDELIVWVTAAAALRGDSAARDALWDRTEPKPSRVSIEATVGARAPIVAGGSIHNVDAEAYYNELTGAPDPVDQARDITNEADGLPTKLGESQ